jgi:hypothetical protein
VAGYNGPDSTGTRAAARRQAGHGAAAALAQDDSLALAIVGIEAHQNQLIAAGIRIRAVTLHPRHARVRARQCVEGFGACAVRGLSSAGATSSQQRQASESEIKDARLP